MLFQAVGLFKKHFLMLGGLVVVVGQLVTQGMLVIKTVLIQE